MSLRLTHLSPCYGVYIVLSQKKKLWIGKLINICAIYLSFTQVDAYSFNYMTHVLKTVILFFYGTINFATVCVKTAPGPHFQLNTNLTFTPCLSQIYFNCTFSNETSKSPTTFLRAFFIFPNGKFSYIRPHFALYHPTLFRRSEITLPRPPCC